MKDNAIIALSDIEHVLLRPNQYIGSMKKRNIETFFYNEENNKFEYKEITYIPAIIKIIMEILDNSVDEAIKTNFKKSNKINIEVTDKSIRIKDNGRGIPVIKEKNTKKYMPLLAWTQLRAGSNFKNDNRVTRGMNGVGSSCTNIFSKIFKAKTCDGKKIFNLKCKNNLKDMNYYISSGKRKGTDIYFEPDLEKFSIDKIDDTHKELIKQIILNNSIIYPKIKFYFNGECINKIKNFKDYVNSYSNDNIVFENDDYYIGIFENNTDDNRYLTFVNGLFMLSGGIHIDYISKRLSYEIRDLVNEKNKDLNLKPSDIRNKLTYIVFLNNFPNPEHSSQTKDSLENDEKDISEYLNDLNFNLIAKKIYKNKNLISPIIDYGKIKKEMRELKDIEKKDKKNKKTLYSPKYIPANSKKRHLCSLFICEGDSAKSPFLVCRESPKYQALFPVKGKIKNVRETNLLSVYKNEELNEILKICKISLTKLAVEYIWGKKFYKVKYPNLPLLIVNEYDYIKIDNRWKMVKGIDDEYKKEYKLNLKEFSIDKNLVRRRVKNIDMNFGKGIKILTDADFDGYSIVGLFINFFSTYFPELFEVNMIKRVISPIVILKNDKDVKRFYSMEDFSSFKKENNISKYNINYIKGLGSLPRKEYALMINDEKYCQILDYSTIRDYQIVDMVYSKNKSDERKKWLSNN
ncbi:MAG: ATP-binding protein [Nanoarchaeota archaeon]